MRVVKEIEIAGRQIKFYELCMAEIRDWMKNSETSPSTDLIDVLIVDEITLPDLYRITSLTKEMADEMTPRELAGVVKVAKEVNLRFFEISARIHEEMMRLLQSPAPIA